MVNTKGLMRAFIERYSAASHAWVKAPAMVRAPLNGAVLLLTLPTEQVSYGTMESGEQQGTDALEIGVVGRVSCGLGPPRVSLSPGD